MVGPEGWRGPACRSMGEVCGTRRSVPPPSERDRPGPERSGSVGSRSQVVVARGWGPGRRVGREAHGLEDLLHDVSLEDDGDQLHPDPAARAGEVVVPDVLQELGPADPCRGGRLSRLSSPTTWPQELIDLGIGLREDLGAQPSVRAVHPVVADLVTAGPRNEGRQLGEEVQRLVLDPRSPVPPGCLEGQAKGPVGLALQTALGDGGAKQVAGQPLNPWPVPRRDRPRPSPNERMPRTLSP